MDDVYLQAQKLVSVSVLAITTQTVAWSPAPRSNTNSRGSQFHTSELSTLCKKDPSVCENFCEYILFLNLAYTHSKFVLVSKPHEALQHCNLLFGLSGGDLSEQHSGAA